MAQADAFDRHSKLGKCQRNIDALAGKVADRFLDTMAMTKVDGIHLNRAVNAGIRSTVVKCMGSLPPIRGALFQHPGNWICYSFSPEGMSVYNSILPQEGQNAAFTFFWSFFFLIVTKLKSIPFQS